jgi:hypothetical protein
MNPAFAFRCVSQLLRRTIGQPERCRSRHERCDDGIESVVVSLESFF